MRITWLYSMYIVSWRAGNGSKNSTCVKLFCLCTSLVIKIFSKSSGLSPKTAIALKNLQTLANDKVVKKASME